VLQHNHALEMIQGELQLLLTVAILSTLDCNCNSSRSQWPRGLRRRSAAELLLGSWVRIPRGGGGMDVGLLYSACVVR
jgi:hypothetical protein